LWAESVADRHVAHLLVGGGLASANCARWLRESGAEGEILLVGREPEPPYNRPPCSKGYLQGKESREDTYFRPNEWWQEQRIDLRTRTSVTKLDAGAKEATLSSREVVGFDTALLATGANVRRLNVEGCELEGIHYLRALGNADAIRADAAGKRVVLIGGSYIGCEVAASLTAAHGSSCAIVMQEAITLSRGFGETAGRFFQARLEEHGVAVHGEDELERFEGADGRVTTVVTKGGLRLEADAVVIGAGVVPDVTLARAAGLDLGERGGVLCDSRLESSVPGIYAAGDIAEYDSVIHGRRLRIEHWDVAFNHGKTAALNLLGRDVPHDVVPYFFSDLADWASLEYVGPASDWDREIARGSLDEGTFSVWYVKDGRVAGALSVGRSDDLEHARRLIVAGTPLGERVEALGDLSSDLAAL
jgi:3-phenylpropionate/trans-cinnamate dioxygenase ferredoxin reductase subunit